MTNKKKPRSRQTIYGHRWRLKKALQETTDPDKIAEIQAKLDSTAEELKQSRNAQGRTFLSPRQFVEIWQTSDTLEDVVKRTGLSKSSAKKRATKYRNRGVPLKHMPRKRARVDWDDLASFAAEIVEQDDSSA